MRICVLTFFILVIQSLPAQVGINIQNPYTNTILHIDAKGNTSGTTNSSDDVVIDASGNIGIGTLLPKAKVDIVKDGTMSLMRIEDGKQAANKVLVSDNSGNASWVNMPSTMGVTYNLTNLKATYGSAYTLVRAIPVSSPGFYQVVIRWWGKSSAVNANKSTAAMFALSTSANATNNWTADQTNQKDVYEKYIYMDAALETFCFALPLSAKITTEAYLKIYIRVSVGGSWLVGDNPDPSNSNWQPSIVVYRI